MGQKIITYTLKNGIDVVATKKKLDKYLILIHKRMSKMFAINT